MIRDFDKEIAEPIEFTLDGKSYKVIKLTDEVMGKVDEILEDEKTKLYYKLHAQLSVMTGVSIGEFAGQDMVLLAKVVKFVSATIKGDLEKK